MFSKIRNNPKKTIFFSAVIGYGLYYTDIKIKEYKYRRQVCHRAMSLSDELIGSTQELTRVTVIHNPVANNRKSSTLFKKDIYPLLNLSGYKVTLAETERAEEGKELMSVLKENEQECVCIAGGDGTLMEVVTGLLRREDLRDKMKQIPLVLMPLGASNSFAMRNNLIKPNDSIGTFDENVRLIKEGNLQAHNVIQLRRTPKDETDPDSKKLKDLYALSGLEWSVDRDVVKVGKRKWVFGPLRCHWQYLVTALLGRHLSTNKSATLRYRDSCDGCSRCTPPIPAPQQGASRFSLGYLLFPLFYRASIDREKQQIIDNEAKIGRINPDCGLVHEMSLADVRGISVVLDHDRLKVRIRPAATSMAAYLQSGVASLTDPPYGPPSSDLDDTQETFLCSDLQIIPAANERSEHFYVDNEQLEAVPIDLRVLKEAVYMYAHP